MAHAPHDVPEQIAPDLEDGETLFAATEADHRTSGGAAIGFVFSGLFSNLVSKAEEGDGGDEQLHLPYGPVLVAVTDRRVLLYSRDINIENGPPKLVVALPTDTIRDAGHGLDPLTDTMHIEFTDDTKLVLYLDTFNHSGEVIKGIRALVKA
jgi:hypothetical protein